MRVITLKKKTTSGSPGTVVHVWEPGAELQPGQVDPQRADQWVKDGYAVNGRVARKTRKGVSDGDRSS